MGIVKGVTKAIYDYGKEEHDESKLWGREKREADIARQVEGERKSWWSIGTTLGCLALGGGPICPVVGAVVGNVAKGVGTWKGKAIESFDLSEDVGKFEKGQIEDVRNYNRALDAGDKAEFWQGIQDIGSSLLFSWKAGGGDITDIPGSIEDWSPIKWGGKGGKTTKEAWNMFFNRPDKDVSDVIDVASTYTGKHGPSYSRYYHDMDPVDTYKSSYTQQPTEAFRFSDEAWKKYIDSMRFPANN